ncbi:uncharacterized protein J8A68_001438 [[Candida] subhashii]|uniref:Uncharacterized protein n=1 Tax=[Candida] subhashii TaxID=561895 RepID=A0A8J5UZU4_9ASCO|nr:uncharacterized protein J8A68_001438 [[Candida] subhashii]KAG7665030.1 hypothetical protein J8A68_001438 [[Candida] subhashii]
MYALSIDDLTETNLEEIKQHHEERAQQSGDDEQLPFHNFTVIDNELHIIIKNKLVSEIALEHIWYI